MDKLSDEIVSVLLEGGPCKAFLQNPGRARMTAMPGGAGVCDHAQTQLHIFCFSWDLHRIRFCLVQAVGASLLQAGGSAPSGALC